MSSDATGRQSQWMDECGHEQRMTRRNVITGVYSVWCYPCSMWVEPTDEDKRRWWRHAQEAVDSWIR